MKSQRSDILVYVTYIQRDIICKWNTSKWVFIMTKHTTESLCRCAITNLCEKFQQKVLTQNGNIRILIKCGKNPEKHKTSQKLPLFKYEKMDKYGTCLKKQIRQYKL